MKRVFSILVLCICVLSSFTLAKSVNNVRSPQDIEAPVDSAVFNVNRILDYFSNDGNIVDYNIDGNAGMSWPEGEFPGICFQTGFWIAGKDSTGDVRCATAEYASELLPGKILPDGSPDDPYQSKYKIYTIDRGNTSSSDYLNWPVADGAPVDDSGNPQLLGDQTHWFVCNDADSSTHQRIFNTDPIGVECQYTIFGVDSVEGLQDIMFIKGLFINKGHVTLDSCYIGLWSDPDLGSAQDDYVGCDTSLNLVYCYNGDDDDYDYGSRIPSFGAQLLQGPMIPSIGNSARFVGRTIPDAKNRGLDNFVFYIGASATYYDPETAQEVFNYIKGRMGNGNPIINPQTGEPSTIYFPGDPVSQTGWVENKWPSERRFLMSSGPFTFAPGDSQEVIYALMVGESVDQYSGITSLRKLCQLTQYLYNSQSTDLALPVEVKDITFDTVSGDSFQIEIMTDHQTGYSIDLAKSRLYISEGLNSDYNELALKPSGTDKILFSDVFPVQHTEYRYYLKLVNNHGDTLSIPAAAPKVYLIQSNIIDVNAPVIYSENLYPYPINQTVFKTGDYQVSGYLNIEDYSPIDSVWLETKINNADWTPSPLNISSIYSQYNAYTKIYKTNISWHHHVSWSSLNYGDSLVYRLVFRDSSAHHNIGYGHRGKIIRTHQANIGRFDYNSTTWIKSGWTYTFLGTPGFFADSIADYQNNINHILRYADPIPAADYLKMYLGYHGFHDIAPGDSAFIELSTDTVSWKPIEKISDLTRNIYQLKNWWTYLAIPDDMLGDSMYLRFRFKTDNTYEDLKYGWFIDGVKLFTDTTIATGGFLKIGDMQLSSGSVIVCADTLGLHWSVEDPYQTEKIPRIEYKDHIHDWTQIAELPGDQNRFTYNIWPIPNTKAGQFRITISNQINTVTAQWPHQFWIQNDRKMLIPVTRSNGYPANKIRVAIIDSTQLTGDQYQMDFSVPDGTYYLTLTDKTRDVPLFDQYPIIDFDYELPIVDGFAIAVDNSTRFGLNPDESGWHNSDCTWKYTADKEIPTQYTADYSIRFTDEGADDVNGVHVPFSVYNLTEQHYSDFQVAINNPGSQYYFGIYETIDDQKQIYLVVRIFMSTGIVSISPESGDILDLIFNVLITDADPFTFAGRLSSLAEAKNIPEQYRLLPNYPNPFNPSTTIRFELPKEAFTEINIYNLQGQLVQTLVSKTLAAGQHQQVWHAGNLPSGIYFYRINVNDPAKSGATDFQKTRKCILLK